MAFELDGLGEERGRLVRLCARITGDPDEAEDLAQETLLEAWRNAHKLHDPTGRSRWLSAVARNVCMRWARGRGRELSRLAQPDRDGMQAVANLDELPANDFDVEVELERGELADLLDRAMGLLPPETRAVLVHKYVEGSPHSEIAGRLGMSEGAVKLRLHRGKLILRHVLTTDLCRETASFGFIDINRSAWQQTRMWCPMCGQHRLSARIVQPSGALLLRCPCCDTPDSLFSRGGSAEFFAGARGYKRAFSRQLAALNDNYGRGVAGCAVRCVSCGSEIPLRVRHLLGELQCVAECGVCKVVVFNVGLSALALAVPEMRRFWREHPRIRVLPEREVESTGRAAAVKSFESVTEGARLDVVLAQDDLGLISVHDG